MDRHRGRGEESSRTVPKQKRGWNLGKEKRLGVNGTLKPEAEPETFRPAS